MRLNLPILEALEGCRSVLVAGMGGGFDVFCGVPILLTLQQAGHTVHLANLSFSDVANLLARAPDRGGPALRRAGSVGPRSTLPGPQRDQRLGRVGASAIST